MKTFQLRPLRAALALACGLAATGGGALAQAAAPGEPAGRLAWYDCPYPIPGEAMRCGTLHVPENYAEPDGRQVALPVAVLPATSGRPAPDPIIYLNGGPGHSAMSWLAVMAGIGAPRASRDLVVLEQRGNGTAEPSLVCGEDEEVRACHDRLLAERIDLAQYGNANAARDVEALRRALGASQVNLYGISYGTTLAMHVMRMFPGGLRSVVLDSPSAPDADITVADVRSQLDGIGRVLAACEADQACGTRFPDLRSRLLEAVERLDASPLAVESDAVRAIVGPEVTGQTLVGIAARAPQSGVLLPRTPALLDALMRGDEARVAELLDGPLPKTPPGFPPEKENSLGLTLSIYCAELPHSRFGQVAIDAEERWPASFEAALTPDYWDICAQGEWLVPPVDSAMLEQVRSDVPTLVLVGEFDPITPLAEAQRAAAGLSSAEVVVIPAETHGVTERDGCAQGLMAAFLDAPRAAPDRRCLDGGRLAFETGADRRVEP